MINTTEIRVYMLQNDNMTMGELAKRIGKSQATLARWFEKKDMPVEYAEKIAVELHIPREKLATIFFATV